MGVITRPVEWLTTAPEMKGIDLELLAVLPGDVRTSVLKHLEGGTRESLLKDYAVLTTSSEIGKEVARALSAPLEGEVASSMVRHFFSGALTPFVDRATRRYFVERIVELHGAHGAARAVDAVVHEWNSMTTDIC